MDKAELERRLEGLAGFPAPSPALEQYPTPAWLAAHVVHLADLRGDLAGRTVLDLGAGTGVLALAASVRAPARVVGIERDRGALAVARENEVAFGPPAPVGWVLGDATRPPVEAAGPATVLMNPPFGAQGGNEGADRAFLRAAAELAAISYSVHNGGSRAFVESFAGDHGGTVTAAFGATIDLDRRFDFHEHDREELSVEVFRIEWG